ncbi:hypothetical protein B0H13DRAFT_1911972 [Mycena leptocephala]|nr:hypothetical protein B0H13DRAFT_1911972 [Mycena leptocephala]
MYAMCENHRGRQKKRDRYPAPLLECTARRIPSAQRTPTTLLRQRLSGHYDTGTARHAPAHGDPAYSDVRRLMPSGRIPSSRCSLAQRLGCGREEEQKKTRETHRARRLWPSAPYLPVPTPLPPHIHRQVPHKVSGTLAAGGLDGLGNDGHAAGGSSFGEDGGKAATRGVSERVKERKHEAGGGRDAGNNEKITDNVPEGGGYEGGKMKGLAHPEEERRRAHLRRERDRPAERTPVGWSTHPTVRSGGHMLRVGKESPERWPCGAIARTHATGGESCIPSQASPAPRDSRTAPHGAFDGRAALSGTIAGDGRMKQREGSANGEKRFGVWKEQTKEEEQTKGQTGSGTR